jgi:hypothetical protein
VGAAVLLPGLPARLAAAGVSVSTTPRSPATRRASSSRGRRLHDGPAPLLTPATLPVAQLFMSHHTDHAEAFGSVAGSNATKTPNAKLVAALGPSIAALKDGEGRSRVSPSSRGPGGLHLRRSAHPCCRTRRTPRRLASILPIEAQHQVVLGLALGKSVTDVFPTVSVRIIGARRRYRSTQGSRPRPCSPDQERRTTNVNHNDLNQDEVRRHLREIDRAPRGDHAPLALGALRIFSATRI